MPTDNEPSDLAAAQEAIFRSNEIAYGFGLTSLGAFAVAHTADGVRAILLGDSDKTLMRILRAAFPDANLVLGGSYGYFDIIVDAVAGLIERPWIQPKLKLDLHGGDFDWMARAALGSLGPGKTATPEQVAEKIGARGAGDAVRELAVRDLLAVATPFHRLQETGGTSPSYRWGETRRRVLLERETLTRAWWLSSPLPGPGAPPFDIRDIVR